MNNDWKHVAFNYQIPACRTGWLGVWDSLKSAVRGDPRPLVPHPYYVGFWVKHNDAGLISDNPDVKENEVYLNGILHRRNHGQ